jgi:hypothetical protein
MIALLLLYILPAELAPPRFDYFESQDFYCWVENEQGDISAKLTFRQLLCWRWEESIGEHVIDHWVMQGTDPAKMRPDPVFVHARGVWQFTFDGRVIEANGYVQSAADFDLEIANREVWAKERRRGLRK